jgi:hypothetical protein
MIIRLLYLKKQAFLSSRIFLEFHNISKDKTSSFILKNNSIKTYCSDIKDKDETIILKE